MHFAAKIHDTDGATVSFASLEIDETKRIYAPPGYRSWIAGMEGGSSSTELTWFDIEEGSNNEIS